MALTMKEKMIIQGCPIAWVFLLTTGTNSNDDTFPELWAFDNLADGSAKKLKAGSSTTSGEFVEFGRCDGAKVQFDKEALTIDAVTETQKATDTGGADASGDAEITLVVNEPPVRSSNTIASNTAFLADVIAHKDDKVLIVMPTGYSYSRLGQGTSRKPDGFVYMFGKLTSDVEIKNSGPSPITLTFASQKANFDKASMAFTGLGILVKRGGSGYDVPAASNVPLDLSTQADIDALNDGLIVIKPNVA